MSEPHPKMKAHINFKGRKLPMFTERNGVWRVRSRSKDFPVDIGTNTTDLAMAKVVAKTELNRLPDSGQAKTKGTLEEVARIYLKIPLKCNDEVAIGNVSRLRTLVAVATGGKSLDAVPVSILPDLWHQFVAAKQGREAPSYALRERQNSAMNSHMMQAASIFRAKLYPHYKKEGVILPPNAGSFERLPVMASRPEAADDAGLVAAWKGLYDADRDLWLAVGLARFAGLRQGEILACRGKWIVQRGAGAVVELQDRDEDEDPDEDQDRFRSKTGRTYTAVILDQQLAEYLLAIHPDSPVINRTDAERWLGREPQAWLRQFTGKAKKPLHRCRGLYADHVRRETEEAILARQAGVKAAQQALGHTNEATTLGHYLTPD